MRKKTLTTFSLTLCLIVGCRKQSGAPPQTAMEIAASQPATTQAVPGVVAVDQDQYDFPPVQIIMQNKDDQLRVLLRTDDPPNATTEEYTGNSIYLEMTDLDQPDDDSLDGATWDFKSTTSDRNETINGILLHGQEMQLQPDDVHVSFANQTDGTIKVKIDGTFLLFDNTKDEPGKSVTVKAELQALSVAPPGR